MSYSTMTTVKPWALEFMKYMVYAAQLEEKIILEEQFYRFKIIYSFKFYRFSNIFFKNFYHPVVFKNRIFL